MYQKSESKQFAFLTTSLLDKKQAFNFGPCIVSMPVKIQAHTVPRYKAPVYGKVEK